MSSPILKASRFDLMEGELIDDPLKTSARDFRLKIKLPSFREWSPGQFVMLRWGEHLIGRPFAIVNWQADREESVLELWIRRLGSGTEELFALAKRGTSFWVTAPLGRGLDQMSAERLLLLSGGVGAASIYPILKARRAAGLTQDYWIHGERETSDLDEVWAVGELKSHVVYYEGGTRAGEKPKQSGLKGRITAAFEGPLEDRLLRPFTAAVACGPSAMLEALVPKIHTHRELANLPIVLGLEEKMGCGIGLCFSCSVSTTGGLQRCCLEGPWFEAEKLNSHFSFRKTGSLS